MNADILHLGCGTDYREHAHNVDVNDRVRVDQRFDLENTPWPLPANEFAEIYAAHVVEHLSDVAGFLAECQRVLVPDGNLRVVVPIGVNAKADPDHENIWMWETPEMYCGKRHWDRDVGFTVQNRDVNLWSTLPGMFGTLHRQTIQARMELYGAGTWCFAEPHTSGEFGVVFA